MEWMPETCYSEASSDSDDDDWPDSYVSEKCFHRQNLVLLRRIQDLAHKETRRSVLLAVGEHLPVELADHIHEYVLTLEGLPLDPGICAKNDDDDWWEPWTVKDEYRCSDMTHFVL